MSALLPCPFCGEGADLMELFEGFCGECGNCETTGPAAETEAAAIAAWNQRATPADPDPARGEVGRMKAAASTINDEVCQTLGKVLGYPWFKDDLVNFPHSTEAHGVCVGDHVAESIAAEAAERIKTLRAEVERLRGALNATAELFLVPEERRFLSGEGEHVDSANAGAAGHNTCRAAILAGRVTL